MFETLKIYGCSDDNVEVEGSFEGADEYPSTGKSFFLVTAPNGENVFVIVNLVLNGTWAVGVTQYEEEYVIPDWNIRIVHDFSLCKYSAILLLDLPEGSTIVETNKRGEIRSKKS